MVALFALFMHVLSTIMDEKVDEVMMEQRKYRRDRLIQFVTDTLKEVIHVYQWTGM
jgi:hypothetical protein